MNNAVIHSATTREKSLPPSTELREQVYAMQGKHANANRVLREAVSMADQTGNQQTRWQARMELASLYADTDPALSEKYFGETLDVLEEGSRGVLFESFRAGWLSRQLRKYDPYDRYIDFLLTRGDYRRAFTIAERARARTFLDTLAAAREQMAGAVPPPTRKPRAKS